MLNHITVFQPSAIDNALSTIQILHKLISQINTIIDEVNSIDSKANEYTDEQITKLKDYLEYKLRSSIIDTNNSLKEYVNTTEEEIVNDINNKIEKLYKDIAILKAELTLYIDDNDNKIKVLIDNMYNELYNLILNGNVIIYSPIDGNLKSVKDTILDINNIIKTFNGVDWDNLELLCNDDVKVTWDSLELKLNEINSKYKNWNSLTYDTFNFINHNLMRTDETIVKLSINNLTANAFFGGIELIDNFNDNTIKLEKVIVKKDTIKNLDISLERGNLIE